MRENYTKLVDPAKRDLFLKAVKKLKETLIPEVTLNGCTYNNLYDRFVCWHKGCGCAGSTALQHHRPSILPWHRELIWRFENEIRNFGGEFVDFTVPYWVFYEAFPHHLKDADADFKFLDDKTLSHGVTINWANWKRGTIGLTRDRTGEVAAVTQAAVQAALLLGKYDAKGAAGDIKFDRFWIHEDPKHGFRPTVERLHDEVHGFIGGNMGVLPSAGSPPEDPADDPVFWLAHAYVDCLWASWQDMHEAAPGDEYHPDATKGDTDIPPDDEKSAEMPPWNTAGVGRKTRVSDVMNSRNMDQEGTCPCGPSRGYEYDAGVQHPTPVLVSNVLAEALPDRARLAWHLGGDAVSRAALYRRGADTDWRAMATLTPDGTGRVAYEDRDIAPGARYGYRLGIVEGGRDVFRGEVWVEIPVRAAFAIERVWPNPAIASQLRVRFTLDRAERATLELLDLAGRVVARREVGPASEGALEVALQPEHAMPPGLCFVRLAQGSRVLGARVVVLR